jgi:O-antigen ligase
MPERNPEPGPVDAGPFAGVGVRARLVLVADWLAAAVAASLPWSTSVSGILIALWLIAVLPTLDAASVRRELRSPARGLARITLGDRGAWNVMVGCRLEREL